MYRSNDERGGGQGYGRRLRTRVGVTAVLAFALTSGCADEPTEPSGSLTVSIAAPTAQTFTVGDTLRLEAEVRDHSGEVLPGVAVEWSSSDVRVVTVSPHGVATAVGPGTATVSGYVGGASGTVQLSVGDPEVAVLLSLYLSTNGDDWTRNDNWLENQDLQTWYGVETDSAGKVTGLDLSSNNLDGRIPPRLGDLAHLRKLDLGGNELAGGIPWELGGLASLEHLDLSGNELDGVIPMSYDVHGLSKLSNVTWLDLSGNRLEGEIPWEILRLADLERLDLSGNDLSGHIPASGNDGLDALSNLTWLDLSGNRLNGDIPWALRELVALERLDLSENELSGHIPASNNDGLDALSNLKWLNLSGNQLYGGIPSELGQLTRLETLWLSYNQLQDSLPPELGQLERLTWLMVGDNPQMRGPLPASFLDLELDVFGYAKTGICVPDDPDFRTWLEEIWQHSGTGRVCGLDRRILAALYNATGGSNWTNDDNWLTDEPLSTWYGVGTDSEDRVTHLWLSGNNLTGFIPPDVGGLIDLQQMFLDNNNLRDSIPKELGDLANLTDLNLYLNNLTGPLPPELGALSNLQTLNVSENNLTGGIPREFGDLASLGALLVNDNPLSGPLPLALERLDLWQFHYHGTALCVPADESFQDWLESISDHQGTGVDCTASETDRDILVTLYNATDGPNWTDDTNWLTEAAIGEWYGVVTDSTGRVTHLYLGENRLAGGIPPELRGLASLQVLELFVNQLTGEIPPELGGLASLEGLSLGDNQLTGEIPPEPMQEELSGNSAMVYTGVGFSRITYDTQG